MAYIEYEEQLSSDQKIRLEKYLDMVCTTRCGNDIDCPHVEQFIEIINEEESEKNS